MGKSIGKLSLTTHRNPWVSFLILILTVFAGLFLGQFLGLVIILPFFDFDMMQTQSILRNLFENPDFKIPMLIFHGVSAIGAFIAAPLVFLHFIEKKSISIFFNNREILLIPLALTIVIVVSFMAVNSVFIEWNANLTLPEFLKPLEDWAMEKELLAKKLTEFLTDFEGLGHFLLGMVVIAILPAVGEELLFRGLIQNQFLAITKNSHAAIWAAGLLFSFFHFQFYGLIPRMFLGVLFGYLYFWSGNLLLPMLAHFVNNGLTLILLYLYQGKHIDYDVENAGPIPWGTVLFSLVLCVSLMVYFKNYFKRSPG